MENFSTTRPRSKSTFSFRSDKSDKSGKPKQKMDLTETEADKRKSKFSGRNKVDPSRALNEPQPSFQALEQSTLPELRTAQLRDIYGNSIVDPDRTNPTRHRLERPLDTIRSFEAAVDSSYKRRSQAVRAESMDAVPSFQRRRPSSQYTPSQYGGSHYGGSHYGAMSQYGGGTSQYGFNDIPHHNPRFSPARAYWKRNASLRGNYENTGFGQFPPRRSMPYRTTTSPLPVIRDNGIYNSHQYRESHDTVNTAADSSGSQSEPWGYSTDPSSENSSIDRVHAIRPMESGDAYTGSQYQGGYHGAGQFGRGSPKHSPIHEESWHDGRFAPDEYQQQHVLPREPQQAAPRMRSEPLQTGYTQPQAPIQRKVIQLGAGGTSSAGAQANYTAPTAAQMRKGADKGRDKPEKKSWLKRTFSKN